MRMEFTTEALDRSHEDLGEAFQREVAAVYGMRWRLFDADQPKRMAILVSRREHCLLDLLWRWRRGELDTEIVAVASNHPDLDQEVRAFGIPYHHVPVTPDTKPEAEARLLELLGERVDLVVLARYMQILSGDFLDRLGVPLINIHHSFLPAFAGAEPYRQAERRGVKIIGATAHYVTEALDARTDNRPGRRPRLAPRRRAGARAARGRHRAQGARARGEAAPGRPRARGGQQDGRVLSCRRSGEVSRRPGSRLFAGRCQGWEAARIPRAAARPSATRCGRRASRGSRRRR